MASDAKHDIIHAAAIAQFSARGFAGTSMANIADAAGMSRPALYQYFKNKADIFTSAFIALFHEHVDSALSALDSKGTVAQQLDGFLQRSDGDLWERTAASPHSDEILRSKSPELSVGINAVLTRQWTGLATYLERQAPGGRTAQKTRRAGWLDVLHYSPKGLKFDEPSVDIYRQRLTALAQSVAADIGN